MEKFVRLTIFCGGVFWWLLLLAWAFINYDSCVEYFHSYAGRKVLIDSFEVGNTEKEVMEILQKVGLKTRDLEREPENQYHKSALIVEVENYKTLGCAGVLSLQFYDGQLYEAWFYPNDFSNYINRLQVDEKTDLHSNDEIYKDGLKIWKLRDGNNKAYVGREDLTVKIKVENLSD